MGNPITIATGYSGLYTTVDSASVKPDDRGLTPIASCSNIDISDSNRMTVRHGYSQKYTASIGTIHSCFGKKELPFILFCEGDALSFFNIATSEVERVQNITVGAPMAYEYVNGHIYYMNGHESGKFNVNSMTANRYIIDTDYHGKKTTRVFSDAPIGTTIHYHKGRMHIGTGKAVFSSEAFDVNRFVFDDNNRLFTHDVNMITSSDNCLVVGTTVNTVCYVGDQKKTLIDAPAIDGTQIRIHPSDIGLDGTEIGVILLTTQGIVFITANGELIKLSEYRIDLPAIKNLQGSAVIRDGKYICQCDTTTI